MTDPDRDLLARVAEWYPRVGPIDRTEADRAATRAVRDGRYRSRSAWFPSWAPIAATVALVLVGVVLGWTLRSLRPEVAPNEAREWTPLAATGEVRIIQFVLEAPKASRVSVVGDFNDWNPTATPLRRETRSVWAIAVPLSPGRHVYSFIVDGERWVPDPSAPLAPDDGFGSRSSVIVVGGPEPV